MVYTLWPLSQKGLLSHSRRFSQQRFFVITYQFYLVLCSYRLEPSHDAARLKRLGRNLKWDRVVPKYESQIRCCVDTAEYGGRSVTWLFYIYIYKPASHCSTSVVKPEANVYESRGEEIRHTKRAPNRHSKQQKQYCSWSLSKWGFIRHPKNITGRTL